MSHVAARGWLSISPPHFFPKPCEEPRTGDSDPRDLTEDVLRDTIGSVHDQYAGLTSDRPPPPRSLLTALGVLFFWLFR